MVLGKHDRIICFILSSDSAAIRFWTSPVNYFYVGFFFKASIYFYLFEDYSIVILIGFSAGILPEPAQKDRLQLTKETLIQKTPTDNHNGPNFIFTLSTLEL